MTGPSPHTLEVTSMVAFCPDDRPPRIIRFTTLPGTFLAKYDEENNLLLIDRAKYAMLTRDEQNFVSRTQRPYLHCSPTSEQGSN